MTYSIIQPPFTLKFREMSKQELKNYFRWFLDIIPQRIQGLIEAVTQSPGFESWTSDYTPRSLEILGDWFASQVETRLQTEEELREMRERLTFPMEIPDTQLTNKTFSIAMDIGMYLSQVFFQEFPELRWEQPLKNKRFVDYGQPVIVEFGIVPLNPVQICVVIAYGISKKTKTGKRLREVYDVWAKKVGPAHV
jgi:hypothetical protein